MRLAVVRQRYSAFGGAERFIQRALTPLADQGLNITLLTREWDSTASERVVTCNPFYLGRLWRDWGFSRSVQAAIQSESFDLVQSHERIPGCHLFRAGDGVHAAWLEARAVQQNYFFRFATTLSPWHRYTLAAEAQMFRDPRLQAVICNSHMVREDIRRIFCVPDEKLHVIYNGVNTADFNPRLRDLHRNAMRGTLNIPLNAVVYLFVGSGFARKGLQALMSAFARLDESNAYLLIVGKDRQQAKYETQVKRLGLSRHVLFAGAQKDVRPFLGTADAFVLPTLYEPLPNAALEAFAAGLPVVTSTRCGVAELIDSGVNGYTCEASDIATLTMHLHALLDATHRAAVGAAAARSIAHLTLENMSSQYLRLYRDLLAKRRATT